MSYDPFVVSDYGRTTSPTLHSQALNRQQQQYDEYVRQHQQRNNRRQGQPSTSTSTSSSSARRSNQSTILPSSSSSPSSSHSPSYDHFDDLTGISDYHLAHDDGPMNASVQMMRVEPNHRYHPSLPSDHSHSASDSPSSDSILSSRLSTWQSWLLFSQRSSSCIRQRVDWGERSARSKIALITTLIICQAIALIIMISGIVHLKDNFGVSRSSSNSVGDKNMCQQLPIFLIVTGVIFTVATLMASLLVLLAVSIERASPAVNNEERYTKRIQRMDCFSLPCTILLLLLAFGYFIWFVIGNVWLFTSHATNESDSESERDLNNEIYCANALYRTTLFTIVSTYVVSACQICIGCMRSCCSKDILPFGWTYDDDGGTTDERSMLRQHYYCVSCSWKKVGEDRTRKPTEIPTTLTQPASVVWKSRLMMINNEMATLVAIDDDQDQNQNQNRDQDRDQHRDQDRHRDRHLHSHSNPNPNSNSSSNPNPNSNSNSTSTSTSSVTLTLTSLLHSNLSKLVRTTTTPSGSPITIWSVPSNKFAQFMLQACQPELKVTIGKIVIEDVGNVAKVPPIPYHTAIS